MRPAARPGQSAALLPAIPLDVARVIDRALAFKKEERWPDAAAMHLALVQAYAAAFGEALPGPRPRTREDVDAYAATAAGSIGGVVPSVHTPMPEGPSLAPAIPDRSGSGDPFAPAGIPPTVPWVPPPRVAPGVSTTAGIAQSSPVVDVAPGPPRGRARAAKLLGVGAAAMLLAAGGALVAVRANSVERPAAPPATMGATNAPTDQALVSAPAPRAAEQAVSPALAPGPVASDLPAARAVEEHESASSPAASGRLPSVAPGHARAPQNSQAAMVASPAVASGSATQAGTPGAGMPAGSPGASLPGVALGAALPPVALGGAAPAAVTPEATAMASAPAVAAERPSTPAPTKPTCRAVPYFDSDGFKRFRQECR